MVEQGTDFIFGPPPGINKVQGPHRDVVIPKLEGRMEIFAKKLRDFYTSRPWARHWMINNESYLWFRYTDEGLHTRIAFFPQKMYTLTSKYPDEFVDVSQNHTEFTYWPWSIDHTYLSPNGLFRGCLKK